MNMSEFINDKDPALIVIADDSEEMRTQLKHYLSADGYRFLEAADGKEALSLIEYHKPDLVMLDLAMPVMDGIAVCTKLRLLPEVGNIPVLMLTAMDDEESIENAFKAGASEYINKPVHWSVLRYRIRSLLEAGRGKARLAAIEELQTINRIVEACTSTLKLDEVLNVTLDEAIAIAGLEGGTICLLGASDTLELVAQRGASEATVDDLTTHEIKVGDCLCGSCARDMKPLILWNREEVLNYSSREAQRQEEIHFHASFPFIYKGRCVGVLCVFTLTDSKPEQRSIKLLETMSGQVSLAIENARLYQETVHNAETLEEKVEERTKELGEANTKLKELDRLKSMFIASMSHELRTPLNSIIGFIGIILQGMAGEMNAEQTDMLRRSYGAARHLLALISDVIDISKIEAGKIDRYIDEFLLGEMMNEAVSGIKTDVDRKGLALEVNVPDNLTLRTDRQRLLQCVLNYLSNAVKFTEKGKITVSAREVDGDVEITVEDTGIGVREEDVPVLFRSFVRLDSPLKISTPGTGLGLYLTKKLAQEVLNGSVSVESTYGKGSTFTLRIPRLL